MTQFDLTRVAPGFPGEAVPSHADFREFDDRQSKALNADDGGTWVPTTPIVIGGSGMQLSSTTPLMGFIGGVKTALGGRMVLGANDFPVLTPARSVSVTFSPVPATFSDLTGAAPSISYLDDSQLAVGGAGVFGLQSAGGGPLAFPIPSRYLQNGANIASVSVRLRVLNRPASLLSVAALPNLNFAGIDVANTLAHQPEGQTAARWTPATPFALNSYVRPTTTNENGLYFKATAVSGTHTTGGAEPAWPTVVGGTVVDNAGANQITWTCIGTSGIMWASTVDGFFGSGLPQTLTAAYDPAFTSNIVDVSTRRYFVQLTNPNDFSISDPKQNLIVTSVTLTFTNITQLTFG